jgi:hypothetical protein
VLTAQSSIPERGEIERLAMDKRYFVYELLRKSMGTVQVVIYKSLKYINRAAILWQHGPDLSSKQQVISLIRVSTVYDCYALVASR